jgi:hypothetical protein
MYKLRYRETAFLNVSLRRILEESVTTFNLEAEKSNEESHSGFLISLNQLVTVSELQRLSSSVA